MRAPRWERRSLLVPGGAVGQMVKELNRNPDEVRLLIRRKDMLPVYAVGDMEALLGIRLEDLQGDVATLLPQLADPAAGRALWKSYAAWDGAQELTDELHMKNGEWVYVDVRRGESDTVDVATLRRSTTLHQQIEKFEKSLQKAEEASQSKTTFLSRMSHEIRTPMNGIIGMLTLAEGKLTPDSPAMQYLHKADELSDHLLSLINDILDMSRIEAGKVELEEKPFSLRALGQKLYDMFAKNLEARGISALVSMARAQAVLQERNYVVPEDVQSVFADVCAHRLVLRPQARVDGVTARDILAEILHQVRPDTQR